MEDRKLFAKLGDIKFTATDGLGEIEKKKSHKFSEHILITGKSVLQDMGDDLDEMTLNISVRAFFGQSCEKALDLFEEMIESGESQKLMIENGRYLGQYVVTELGQTIKMIGSNGTINSVDLSINLKEFYDQEPVTYKRVEIIKAKNKKKASTTKKDDDSYYVAPKGERWDSVSYKIYGNGDHVQDLMNANPSVPQKTTVDAMTKLKIPKVKQTTPTIINTAPWQINL